jgi:hypothetical protein
MDTRSPFLFPLFSYLIVVASLGAQSSVMRP